MKEIGDRIKEIRKKRGIKQEDIAVALKKSRATVTLIEKGEHNGTFEMLKNICETLNVSADYILFGEERSTDNLPKLSPEGEKLLEEYIEFLEEKYPRKNKKIVNL